MASLENLCLQTLSTKRVEELRLTHPDLHERKMLMNLFDRFKKIYDFKPRPPASDGLLTLKDVNLAEKIIPLRVIKEEACAFIINGEKDEYCEDGAPVARIDTTVPEYQLPKDIALFYELHNGGTLFSGIPRYPTEFIGIEKWTGPEGLIYSINPYLYESDSKILDQTIMTSEWFVFYVDEMSVDNSAGSFSINLNPKSPMFGHIYSYSSSDEGQISLAACSFAELLYKCCRFEFSKKFSLCDKFNDFW